MQPRKAFFAGCYAIKLSPKKYIEYFYKKENKTSIDFSDFEKSIFLWTFEGRLPVL